MPRGARAQTPGACAAEPASFLDEFLDGVALHRSAATALVAALRDQAAGDQQPGVMPLPHVDLLAPLTAGVQHQPATQPAVAALRDDCASYAGQQQNPAGHAE